VPLRRVGVIYFPCTQLFFFCIRVFVFTLRPFGCLIGSAICLIPSVQPLLQQLGLLDEIKRRSKPFGAMVFREEDLEIIGTFSSRTPLDIQER